MRHFSIFWERFFQTWRRFWSGHDTCDNIFWYCPKTLFIYFSKIFVGSNFLSCRLVKIQFERAWYNKLSLISTWKYLFFFQLHSAQVIALTSAEHKIYWKGHVDLVENQYITIKWYSRKNSPILEKIFNIFRNRWKTVLINFSKTFVDLNLLSRRHAVEYLWFERSKITEYLHDAIYMVSGTIELCVSLRCALSLA